MATAAQDKRRVVLVMTIEIKEGLSERIELREGDLPQQHAIQFCQKHGLDQKIVLPLTAHIQEHLDKVVVEKAKGAEQRETPKPVMSTPRMRNKSQLQPDTKPKPRKSTSPQETPSTSQTQDGQKPAVFNRLYKLAEARQKKFEELKKQKEEEDMKSQTVGKVHMSDLSKELMRGRTQGEYSNYGERLYVEGVLNKKQKDLKEQKHHQEIAELEAREFTGAPIISDIAKQMQRPGSNAWDRLQDSSAAEAKKSRLEQQKKEQEMAATKACSFRPQINKKSTVLMKERSTAFKEHNLSAHEQLFHDAERRRTRQEEYSNWLPDDHTFQPNMSSTGSHRSNTVVIDGSNVVERMVSADKRKEQRLEQLRNSLQIDPGTGQRLFQPVTGRAPQFGRNNGNLSVGEYLYSIRHEFEDKKEYIAERERQNIDEDANRGYAGSKSQKIVSKMKQRMFKELFYSLDTDADGLVNCKKVLEQEDISLELQHDLDEAAQIIGDKDVNLTEFENVMEIVLNGSHTGPRGYLVPESRKTNVDDHSYKPHLNKNSKMLAQRRRGKNQPVYEALMQDKQASDKRLQELKELKDEAIMSECTFNPKIKSSTKFRHLASNYSSTSNTDKRFQDLEKELQDVLGMKTGSQASSGSATKGAWMVDDGNLARSLDALSSLAAASSVSKYADSHHLQEDDDDAYGDAYDDDEDEHEMLETLRRQAAAHQEAEARVEDIDSDDDAQSGSMHSRGGQGDSLRDHQLAEMNKLLQSDSDDE